MTEVNEKINALKIDLRRMIEMAVEQIDVDLFSVVVHLEHAKQIAERVEELIADPEGNHRNR